MVVRIPALIAALVALCASASFSMSDAGATFPGQNGKIAFTRGTGQQSEILVMNADSTDVVNLTNNDDGDIAPAWSADGTKIAFASDREGNLDIWTMKADGSDSKKLTDDPTFDCCARWSPDGSRLVFHSQRSGNIDVWVMNADGSEQTNLTQNEAIDGFPDWSPDGLQIAFSSDRGGGERRLLVMNPDGTGVAQLGAGVGNHPSWSPDGERIAFDRPVVDLASDRQASDVFVINRDGSGETRLTMIAAADGNSAGNPSWSPDGTKILFDRAFADGSAAVFQMNADGSDARVVSPGGLDYDGDWQPVSETSASPTPGGSDNGGGDSSTLWIVAGVGMAIGVLVIAGGAFAVMGRR